ncbi:armadillo-type protein [Desarmillaria tabescens]|uniref:Armadillo-type protein n=1 Tax=Armillaria tabescens TaxID=1929756 RepID=A0AA39JT94_ARMTA|nr:armadillo-type protein [Desarmillaria tabescens]KAK0448379.1 armadillo-type protein [Desarmillaria tabescens]
MSVSLVSNAYLDDASIKIRSKPVPWEGYQRADLITSEELALIKKVDRQPKTKIESILLSDARTYASLYLRLLKKLQRVDTMQYILVLIADALTDHDERIPLFTSTVETDPELPYGPLLRTLDTQDEFMQLKAAQILTVLLCSESYPLQHQYLQPFLVTLAGFVQGKSPNRRDVAVQCLEALLTRPECRQAVWDIAGIIVGSPFQLWLLSFEQNIAEQFDKKYDIIPLLIDVAQGAAKEKVIRVIAATFRNLLTKAPAANLPAMLVSQLLPFAKNLCTRKFTDEDIVEDVQFLRDELNENFYSLTTYDEYTSELSSGHLSWTPVHESDDFWKENATKLNEQDCQQLKLLLKLLKESSDPTVLAVAAHDVGQYVKHCERGKKLVTDLGGKTRVMELMTHEDPDVRYRALMSVQQLISQPWVTV